MQVILAAFFAHRPLGIGLVAAGIGITLVPASVQVLHRADIDYAPLQEAQATSPIIISRRIGDA